LGSSKESEKNEEKRILSEGDGQKDLSGEERKGGIYGRMRSLAIDVVGNCKKVFKESFAPIAKGEQGG